MKKLKKVVFEYDDELRFIEGEDGNCHNKVGD